MSFNFSCKRGANPFVKKDLCPVKSTAFSLFFSFSFVFVRTDQQEQDNAAKKDVSYIALCRR